MEPINTFAQAPQTSEGYYNRNNAIAPEIIKYLEDHSDLRQFFTPKPMKGVLSKTFRIEKDEGIAVQIAGNSEVPREENIRKLFTIFLHRNATGYKIDDDEKRINDDDPSFESRKMQAAMDRMLKKERLDIINVMMTAAGTGNTVTTYTDKITVSAINNAVVQMIKDARADADHPISLEPDTIIMSYAMFNELQQDPKFQFVPEIFQRVLLDAKLQEGGNRGILYGETGQSVAGLNIIIANELMDQAIILDSSKDAFWLAEDQEPTIHKYRDEEHISDVVDIRHDQQPVCVRTECSALMKKQ